MVPVIILNIGALNSTGRYFENLKTWVAHQSSGYWHGSTENRAAPVLTGRCTHLLTPPAPGPSARDQQPGTGKAGNCNPSSESNLLRISVHRMADAYPSYSGSPHCTEQPWDYEKSTAGNCPIMHPKSLSIPSSRPVSPGVTLQSGTSKENHRESCHYNHSPSPEHLFGPDDPLWTAPSPRGPRQS